MSLYLSKQGHELIQLYSEVKSEFCGFEVAIYKQFIKDKLQEYNCSSLIDYGSGGNDYDKLLVREQISMKQYLEITDIQCYEPNRNQLSITPADCVISFDVMEHVYILDIFNVLEHIAKNTRKLVILNIATYDSIKVLPNNEMAHITKRPATWWIGVIDMIAIKYPHLTFTLLISNQYKDTTVCDDISASKWVDQTNYITDIAEPVCKIIQKPI